MAHFRYMLPIWGMGGKTEFHKAQILQNRILRILFNYDRLANTDNMYTELNVIKLDKLLELEQCKLIFKILHNQQKCNTEILVTRVLHNHETRSHNNLYQVPTRTNKGLNNPITDAIKSYNNLPHSLKNVYLYKNFVKKLKSHLNC